MASCPISYNSMTEQVCPAGLDENGKQLQGWVLPLKGEDGCPMECPPICDPATEKHCDPLYGSDGCPIGGGQCIDKDATCEESHYDSEGCIANLENTTPGPNEMQCTGSIVDVGRAFNVVVSFLYFSAFSTTGVSGAQLHDT